VSSIDLTDADIAILSGRAWEARKHAHLIGTTKVGCAVLSDSGVIFAGCNVEHRFRSHDIHAEANALSNMVSGGSRRAVALLIAAEREQFTPCGACMDWIMELGGADCLVLFQPQPDRVISRYLAGQLMPFYPR
jgi:cytidine deaminase